MRHIVERLQEQAGSQVAQTTGIAMLVAAIVAAIFGGLPSWQAGVVEGLQCYVARFDGGGCSGAGAALQALAPRLAGLFS